MTPIQPSRLSQSALAACFLILWALHAPAAPAPSRVWQPEDLAALRAVKDPQLSPDGNLVAYTVENIDLAKDKRFTHLWLARWDGSENRALTSGETTENHPALQSRRQTPRLPLQPRATSTRTTSSGSCPSGGGEAEKDHRDQGRRRGFRLVAGFQRASSLVVHDPDPRDPEGHEKDKKTVPPLVIDRFQFKQDIEGYLTGPACRTCASSISPRARSIPSPTGRTTNCCPPGRRTARKSPSSPNAAKTPTAPKTGTSTSSPPDPGRSERQLTTSPEADAHPVAGLRPGVESRRQMDRLPARWRPEEDRVRRDDAGGDPVGRRRGALAHAARWTATSPAALVGRRQERVRFFTRTTARRVSRGCRWRWTCCRPETLVGGRRKVADYRLGRDGRTGVLGEHAGPAATRFTPWRAGRRGTSALPFQTERRIAGPDPGGADGGDEVQERGRHGSPRVAGAPARTRPRRPAAKAPALLRPHGGPQAQYACEFSFEAQLFASHGYAVILPNPRGSTGRGEAYAMGIYAAWGSVDVQDDLAAVDDAVARGIADPERLGRGRMELRGDVHELSDRLNDAFQRRRRAARRSATSSRATARTNTFATTRRNWAHRGRTRRRGCKISYPFYHADRIKTPTLFLCGTNDFNVPLLNSEQMYQALRTLRVPTELVIYPGQFHGVKTPSYNVDCARRYLEWYAKWVLGEKR